jgi:hypothetical protein
MPAIMLAVSAMAADAGYLCLMVLMARIAVHHVKFIRKAL